MTYNDVYQMLSEEAKKLIDDELTAAYDDGFDDGRSEGYWEGEESVDCDEEEE